LDGLEDSAGQWEGAICGEDTVFAVNPVAKCGKTLELRLIKTTIVNFIRSICYFNLFNCWLVVN
jgi:hypothetical protein